jgi:SPP1 gp7 family putative phage head morphogenesis protein
MEQLTEKQIATLFTMKPSAALRWLENKGLRIRTDAEAMSAADHAMSFGFANLSRLDIAQDIVNGLKEALDNGQTQQQFIKNLEPVLRAKGWWGTREEIDTETGEIKQIRMGSPRRLATIYETNLASAYNAGRFESMTANGENRPYWKYTAVMDASTRPSHAALHDKVFRYDDPIWKILFPPNGFNCRCRVEALTLEDVKARGYTIHSTVRIVSQEVSGPADANGDKSTTLVRGVEFTDGENVSTFYPDAGFDHNPALTVYQANPDAYSVELARPYTKAALTGPQMEQLYHAVGTGEALPAAVLDTTGQKLYNLTSRTVWFNEPAITAQRVAGTLPALPLLPTAQLVIESPALTVRMAGKLEFYRLVDGNLGRAIVNPTTMAVESYMVVSADEMWHAIRNGEVLYAE